MFFPARTALALLLTALSVGETAPGAELRPFAVGEQLHYRVSLAGVKARGQGVLQVLPQQLLEGAPAVVLAFDIDVVLGFQRLQLHSRSWLSTERFAALRYESREKNPFFSSETRVRLDPASRRWTSLTASGLSTTAEPLDELSFIFLIRTLPFTEGTVRIDRHYDAAKNPVTVRLVGRERVRFEGREIPAVRLEMSVHDPKRFGGPAVLRFLISDDARRLPLRIELPAPVPAPLVLELEPAGPPEVTP